MTYATDSAIRPQPATLRLSYTVAGLAAVTFAGHELGSVCRTSDALGNVAYQAIAEGGKVLGLFDREFKAVEAIKVATF